MGGFRVFLFVSKLSKLVRFGRSCKVGKGHDIIVHVESWMQMIGYDLDYPKPNVDENNPYIVLQDSAPGLSGNHTVYSFGKPYFFHLFLAFPYLKNVNFK